VARRFACGCRPVVAGRAAPRRHPRMAKRRWNPRSGPVTGIA
jgi:hypothetical protein